MRDEFGVNSEDLKPNEIPGYVALVESARNNTLTVEKIRGSIALLKEEVERELGEIKQTPQTWLSLVSFFIPMIGMMRKWYQDQRIMYLHARLRNLILIYNIFVQSDKVHKVLEDQINNLRKAQEQGR